MFCVYNVCGRERHRVDAANQLSIFNVFCVFATIAAGTATARRTHHNLAYDMYFLRLQRLRPGTPRG